MKEVLYASFSDAYMAEKAIGALLDQRIEPENISVVFNEAYENTGSKALVHGKGDDLVENAKTGITTTTAADAEIGAAKGAGIGLSIGVLGVLASLFMPGIGLVVGGGALATAIGAAVGTTAAGAIAGGVVGFLKDQGVPELAANRFQEAIVHGGAIIAVNLPIGEVSQSAVRQILSKYQANNFNSCYI